MLPFPMRVRPEDLTREMTALNRKVMAGLQALSRVRTDDIQIGSSPKEVVYEEDKLSLYHFTPLVEKPLPVPLLIVYSLVNTVALADLQPGRSLVQNLLRLGLDVYAIDWGHPDRGDRWLTLDDYINGYMANCVDVVRQRHGLDRINVLGICQGGTFALCYAALHDTLKNLVVMVSLVDFHAAGSLLNEWAGTKLGTAAMDPDLWVEALGNVPGDMMNYGFLMLKPFELSVQKYIDLLDMLDDEDRLLNFLHMEKWIFDSPDQAGEAWREFIKYFYQENRLVKGELELGGRRVDLGNIRIPVLNVYAEHDHLVPNESTTALERYVGSEDYTARRFPVGHIGMYVSGKAQSTLPPTIAEWLKARM